MGTTGHMGAGMGYSRDRERGKKGEAQGEQ